MDSLDGNNPFGDIEQDNNPSLYGNPSVINDPYGNCGHSTPLAESASINADDDVSTLASQYEHLGVNGSVINSTTVHSNEHEPGMNSELKFLHKQSQHNSQFFQRPVRRPQPHNSGLNINDSLVISSRISSLLSQDCSLQVISTEKLMNSSSVTVYCIELRSKSSSPGTGIIVKRRYSEFKSLRDHLMKLFPSHIIPPIPQKHSLLTYLLTSLNNDEELSIVDTRRRLFNLFLNDLVFNSNQKVRDCILLHKFLDPNYEMGWENALNEPPVTLIPDNLLLANPINPLNPNALYSLLPVLNGYEPGSKDIVASSTLGIVGDNLGSLKRLNEDLIKIGFGGGIPVGNNTANPESAVEFKEIPISLIEFESEFSRSIKITTDLDKLNVKTSGHLKLLVSTLIELGSNLNNFSLQIHTPTNTYNNNNAIAVNLAHQVEKFGSTIDSVFLNYESYTMNSFIPKWQEPIHQLILHYVTAVQLLRFYKLKLIQYKILKKSRGRKAHELELVSNSLSSLSTINEALRNGLELNSPSITEAVKKFEQKQRRYKKNILMGGNKGWYGLFGGKGYGNINYENLKQAALNEQTQGLNGANTTTTVGDSSESNGKLYATEELSNAQQLLYKHKLEQLELEISKLDQLIELTNKDMRELTQDLELNFDEFMKMLEKRWLRVMLEFIRGGKKLFEENLQSWEDMKSGIPDTTI